MLTNPFGSIYLRRYFLFKFYIKVEVKKVRQLNDRWEKHGILLSEKQKIGRKTNENTPKQTSTRLTQVRLSATPTQQHRTMLNIQQYFATKAHPSHLLSLVEGGVESSPLFCHVIPSCLVNHRHSYRLRYPEHRKEGGEIDSSLVCILKKI